MEIDVRIVSAHPYFEIAIQDGNATMVHGLLSKEEALEMAKAFIGAAEDLLPGFNAREQLIEIREGL